MKKLLTLTILLFAISCSSSSNSTISPTSVERPVAKKKLPDSVARQLDGGQTCYNECVRHRQLIEICKCNCDYGVKDKALCRRLRTK